MINLKIAILYCGMPFFSKFCFNNTIKNIVNEHEVDYYISIYDEDKSNRYIKDIENYYKPISMEVEKYSNVADIFEEKASKVIHKHPETDPVKPFSMFYKLNKVFKLLEIENKKYDIIIRSRFDIHFDSILNLEINDKLNVPSGGDHRGGLMDLFSYSNYDIMKFYCDIYNYTDWYLDGDMIFHPEVFFCCHILTKKIPLNRFYYNVYLRGKCFTCEIPCYCY